MSNKLSIFKMKGEVLEIIDNGARDLIAAISSTISNLKAVAFSGSYTDLIDTPTIPTVNNGTLTIQKNGEAVQTFSANQSGNATANITVPTTAGEISFNNTGTGLSATDIQNAISEVNSNLSITSVTTPTTTNGTNATLYKSGNVITCKIETSNTQELGTQSAFATIGIIPPEHPEFIPDYSVIKYMQISSNLHGILRIGTDGVIGLGYTVDQSGTAAPIPINTNIYEITTYVSN